MSRGVATGPEDSLAGRGCHLPEGSAQAAAGCHRLLNSSASQARRGVVEGRLERGIELGAIVEASAAVADSHPDGLESSDHGEMVERPVGDEVGHALAGSLSRLAEAAALVLAA